MPNHVHLVIQPEEPKNLSLFMKQINQIFAQYFNGKYNKCGHLWSGRFKSKVLLDEEYLFDCIKYIEFNPLREQLVDSLADYPWSSYQTRVFEAKNEFLDSIGDTPEINSGTVPKS